MGDVMFEDMSGMPGNPYAFVSPWGLPPPAVQLAQLTSQYNPMQNLQVGMPMYGSTAIPGLGPIGELAGQFANMGVGSYVAGHGMPFAGLFAPPANLSGSLRNRFEFMQMQIAGMATLQESSNLTRDRLGLMAKPFAALAGKTGTEAEAFTKAFADRTTDFISSPWGFGISSALAATTGFDLMDIVAPQVNLSRNLYRAGLGTYRGDGRFGLTATEVTAQTQAMAAYFAPQGYLDPSRAHGMTLGNLGEIQSELVSRNLAPAVTGNVVKDNQALTQAVDSAASVLQIVKELTGSENVKELMNTAQALTGGGLGIMSTGELKTQLGRIQELVRTSRVSIEQVSFIQQAGAVAAQQAGLSGHTGAMASIDQLERATIASAELNKQLAGETPLYRVTLDNQNADNQRAASNAMTSVMGAKLGGFLGILEDANHRAGGRVALELQRLQAARDRGQLSAQETATLNTYERAQRVAEGTATTEDLAQLQGVAGRRLLTSAAERLTGMSAQAVSQQMEDRSIQALGLQQHPGLVGGIVQLQTLEYEKNAARTLAGSSSMDRLHLSEARKGALADAIAKYTAEYVPSGAEAAEYRDQLRRRFGSQVTDQTIAALSGEATSSMLVQGVTREQLTHMQARSIGDRHYSAFQTYLQGHREADQKIRDIGALPVLERLFRFAANPGDAEGMVQALGGLNVPELTRYLKPTIERIQQTQTQLNNSVSPEIAAENKKQLDAAIKAQDEAKTAYYDPKSSKFQDAAALRAANAEVERLEKEAKKTVISESQEKSLRRQLENDQGTLNRLVSDPDTLVKALTSSVPPKATPAGKAGTGSGDIPGLPGAVSSATPGQLKLNGTVKLNLENGTAVLDLFSDINNGLV